ncbi:response regulator transcription factor [Helcobacillus massiliensis]|uniref:DNA-binding response OmpR family regulator n=1 Tax=Helcobacillus massiliensis TaxID=521392 RepID=A0A839QQL9_9MICO|nr:response regulator transcription factor [Helcobacillus massiliensis]MCG7427499.1 response regulator transcription factor [Helcobacillus sp. ACRRO]MBB3021948.1 DNA-binding response OmpR family regulator [Helcobacillus massiliensis]MCT1557497.1 response regulator transcription factor [Helcobacillus massiliensis]MCT2036322.1 response regulator transcription factor [Helcobacillus massiliensis]MCT2331936.1 response regulator transcription factor [Helcobacillus massiliensis]
MTRLLLVEDDSAIAEPLSRALDREGYSVMRASRGMDALAAAAQEDPIDFVILDLGLPDIDGLEVARRLRKGGVTAPILILTARADEVDAVVGLDAGADDYVTKPFRLGELQARIRALLRRTQAVEEQSDAFSVNGVELDASARRAYVGGEELTLSAKEFDLLAVLIREAGSVVTRDDLMREVWGAEWWGSTKTLDMHISWLRRKLGDDATNPTRITTVRGVGFRFENPAES